MPYTFTDPVQYHLTRNQNVGNLQADFQKIIDYLITFVGEIQVKKENDGLAIISYADIPFQALLKTYSDPKAKDTVVSSQITLTCERDDTLSVHLIKNVTKNIGYRIFNAQTKSYLVNDPNILDLTVFPIEPKTFDIFKSYNLSPFLQYKDALVFFASDKKGRIHLVNRHLLAHLIENPPTKLYKGEFSIIVASDIGRFVALFDRGLIPLAFHKYLENHNKITNLSGLNIDNLQRGIALYPVYFNLDLKNQSFIQTESTNLPNIIDLKKGTSLVKRVESILKKSHINNYLALKIAQDVGYDSRQNHLTSRLSISVFLDS